MTVLAARVVYRLANSQLPAESGSIGSSGCLFPYSRGCLRMLEAVEAVEAVEGGESGGCGGGSWRWACISSSPNHYRSDAVEFCAVVVCACASRVDSLAGSVADALAVIWRLQAARVLGIPAAMRTGVCDVIVSNVACYCEEKIEDGNENLCARRLSLQRPLKHAECEGVVGVGEK